jgi:hypothetical protein
VLLRNKTRLYFFLVNASLKWDICSFKTVYRQYQLGHVHFSTVQRQVARVIFLKVSPLPPWALLPKGVQQHFHTYKPWHNGHLFSWTYKNTNLCQQSFVCLPESSFLAAALPPFLRTPNYTLPKEPSPIKASPGKPTQVPKAFWATDIHEEYLEAAAIAKLQWTISLEIWDIEGVFFLYKKCLYHTHPFKTSRQDFSHYSFSRHRCPLHTQLYFVVMKSSKIEWGMTF